MLGFKLKLVLYKYSFSHQRSSSLQGKETVGNSANALFIFQEGEGGEREEIERKKINMLGLFCFEKVHIFLLNCCSHF